MQAIGVDNCNKSENHAPHDCATDAVTRISLAQPHDDKARPPTLLAEGSNDQLNCSASAKARAAAGWGCQRSRRRRNTGIEPVCAGESEGGLI